MSFLKVQERPKLAQMIKTFAKRWLWLSGKIQKKAPKSVEIGGEAKTPVKYKMEIMQTFKYWTA